MSLLLSLLYSQVLTANITKDKAFVKSQEKEISILE